MDFRSLADNPAFASLDQKCKIFLIDLAERVDGMIPMKAVSIIYARIGAIPLQRPIGRNERKAMVVAVLDAADSNEKPRYKRIFELLDC